MKYIFTFLFATVMMSTVFSQVEKTVIVEHFTNTRCGTCAAKKIRHFMRSLMTILMYFILLTILVHLFLHVFLVIITLPKMMQEHIIMIFMVQHP